MYFISYFSENATDSKCAGAASFEDNSVQNATDYCSSETRNFQDYIAMLSMLTILYNNISIISYNKCSVF